MGSTKDTLLIVEDDVGIQNQLRWSFDEYEVLLATDREGALTHLRRSEPPVVMLDLGLPPDADGAKEGLATLEQILSLAPDTKVVVVTGNDDRENAVRAVGAGAYDYYQKPIDAEILRLIVERAFRLHALEMENRVLNQQRDNSPLNGIMAASASMLKVCQTVEKVAPTSVTVLLLGESGTGKELLANALHKLSPRTGRRFIAINCAAIPDALLESELFGYEKGAFTGASKQTRGKIEYADGGTLFLDEIGDLPLGLQSKMLRFLQQRVIERLGGREAIPVDVRVVCATHRDLPTLVSEGKFREDLYYRISEITIKIPALRERDGDAALLAHSFLASYNKQHGRNLHGFSQSALAAIESYHWPGNVRELENKLKRAVIMAEGSQISADDLELSVKQENAMPFNLREVRENAERTAVQRALSMYNGNVTQAAEILGISRPTLYDMLNKYGLK